MEQRKKELERLCKELDDQSKTVVSPLIDDVVFIEKHLTELKRYPFIEVNPKNPMQQRPTAAAKQYKELLQQYNNCIKILLGVLGKVEATEESPLRQYLNALRANE